MTMRIAYLFERNDASGSGVFRKIIMQVTQWQAQGHKVALFSLSCNDTSAEWQAALPAGIAFTQANWASVQERLHAMNTLVQQIIAWEPSLVYTRHGQYYPALERLMRNLPFVSEINSDDLSEARARSMKAYGYRKITRWRTLKHAAGLIFVSRELAQHAHFAAFQQPRTVIPNSIDLNQFEPLPAPNNPQPRLFFIGHPYVFFHGVEKIEALARHFTGWHFDVVGPGADEFSASPPRNLHIHGLMGDDDYLPLLAQADIALGTLALERKQMIEASPLKVCEYMARGIPAIIGYKDTNFPQPPEFILQLPASETNVTDNFAIIEQFVHAQKGKRVPREAIEHIDIRHTEARRLAFFAEIIGR